jgi:hypothetical protein
VSHSDYENEEWVALYRAAILELEHAKISDRINATRTAVLARIEKLQNIPGLHSYERQALADALSGLRVLQDEERRYDAEQKRRAIEGALEKLRSVAPQILKRQDEDSNSE